MSLLHLDDFQSGQIYELGSESVSREEILAFAKRYDPQPFHVDDAAAGDSIFGGLIASGWHTCSLTMRLMVDNLLSRSASLGSPGVNQIRWLLPVRPGDTLTARARVLAVTPSTSKPDRGTVEMQYEVRNQEDKAVIAMQGISMFRRRPATA
ncbi:MAG: MaoC family dehydratase [Nevskiaceae bacterium]|nr:MAG: MaoC family dehydratase [Nevskiaceae bacterium]